VILLGLGGNLASPEHGEPRQTLDAALAALPALRVRVAGRSSWYRSAPVPPSGQPWYVNAVARLDTGLSPHDLLAALQGLETRFGRVRGARNAARVIDLDLLDYDGAVIESPQLVLPHPRLHLRRFVLLPLSEVAPGWRHPGSRLSAGEMLAALPPGDAVARIEEGDAAGDDRQVSGPLTYR
jgi:2-amino-4-hydroxy-6-hydroxymethyldihydropteridine diphosphokinase